jgi:ABC-type phosphate transport system ATPase subunit
LQLIAISGFELAEADLDVIDLGGVITADESEVRSTKMNVTPMRARIEMAIQPVNFSRMFCSIDKVLFNN